MGPSIEKVRRRMLKGREEKEEKKEINAQERLSDTLQRRNRLSEEADGVVCRQTAVRE